VFCDKLLNYELQVIAIRQVVFQSNVTGKRVLIHRATKQFEPQRNMAMPGVRVNTDVLCQNWWIEFITHVAVVVIVCIKNLKNVTIFENLLLL